MEGQCTKAVLNQHKPPQITGYGFCFVSSYHPETALPFPFQGVIHGIPPHFLLSKDLDEIFKPFRNLGFFPISSQNSSSTFTFVTKEKVDPLFKMLEERILKYFIDTTCGFCVAALSFHRCQKAESKIPLL